MDLVSKIIDEALKPWAITVVVIQVLLLVIVILAVAAGLYFLVRRRDRRDAEALGRLAERRGWIVERKMAERGRGYRIEVRPVGGADWSCEVTRYENIGRGGFVRTTEFADATARLSAGRVVIGPGLPGKEAGAASMLFGQLDGTLGRMLLSKVLGEEAKGVSGLQWVKEAGIAGATVFATPDAPTAKVGAACAPLLERWLAAHREEKDFPILIAGSDRLRIRLRTDACAADRLEAFLDYALAVREALLKC